MNNLSNTARKLDKCFEIAYIVLGALAIACIVAAYESDGKEPPITSEDIMYHATREEVVKLVQAVVEMRTEWLFVPSTIPNEMKPTADGGKRKNAPTPTKRSKRA